MQQGELLVHEPRFDRAKEVYLEAIGVSADCLEAIYNLGVINVHCGRLQEAMLAFDKLTSITHHDCEVMWQMGDVNEQMGNHSKALEWFSLILTSPKGRPTDPGVLGRVASLFGQTDETQAFHYNLEAYRYWPVNLDVITWLGIYHVKQEMYEQALPFFSRAAEVQPKEVKWLLMVASCYRRMAAYPQALKTYEDVHRQHPHDQECLRYLCSICKEMGLDATKYSNALRKLERLQEQAQEMQAAQGVGDFDDAGFEGFDRLPTTFDRPAPQHESVSAPTFEEEPDLEKKPKRQLVRKEREEEELDWGDDDLGDDLLPQ